MDFISGQLILLTNPIYRIPGHFKFVNKPQILFCDRAFLTVNTVEPLLRGHPDERPTPLERSLDNVNLNINVLISTPDERPPLLKGHISGAKGVTSQEGFHCTYISILLEYEHHFPSQIIIVKTTLITSIFPYSKDHGTKSKLQ